MRGYLTLLLFTLPLTVIASGGSCSAHSDVGKGHGGKGHGGKGHGGKGKGSGKGHDGKTYKLAEMHRGKDFFDGWNFYSNADPTHGHVNYLNYKDATAKGLAYVQHDGTAVVTADYKNHIPKGGQRDSVRISSKKQYNSGLFIADFYAMPTGCSLWPSWWSSGPKWPDAGEIDIIEGVNRQSNNQMSLHTGAGCTLSKSNKDKAGQDAYTGHVLGTQCASSQQSNSGCGILDSDTRSFGKGFNDVGGGVYAHLWDGAGIKIWHFSRKEIPKDIQSGHPNPSSWPAPTAFWSSTTCDISKHFWDHGLTLDIEICGDWAGSAYRSSGCPGSCEDAVADPKNFADAKWKINYVAVYN